MIGSTSSLSLGRHSGGERRRRVCSPLSSTSPFPSFGRWQGGRIARALNLYSGVPVFRHGACAPNLSCSRTGAVIALLFRMTAPFLFIRRAAPVLLGTRAPFPTRAVQA